MYLVSFFLHQYKYPSEFSDGKKLLDLPMDAYQTPEPSILQDSTLRPGHDEALANPDSKFLGGHYVSNAVLALIRTGRIRKPTFPHSRSPGPPRILSAFTSASHWFCTSWEQLSWSL